jgi:hypothetical protein
VLEVYALVGPSGTGKSHRAAQVAAQMGISALVDDGILVVGGQIVAGRSAKREPTRLAAVRRAIFQDPEHAHEVREALRRLDPPRILLLGTSRHMVECIAQRLGLPMPVKVLSIEEVASAEDIATARRVRQEEGKHVIPAPTLEVRRSFPGYLVDPLRLWLSWGGARREVEKSVVRPSYSALGRFTIRKAALRQLLRLALQEADPALAAPVRVTVAAQEGRLWMQAELAARPVSDLLGRLAQMQERAASRVEELTALSVERLDLTVVRLRGAPRPRT